MSRDNVAWVTVNPSVARASRSSSWLSMRRSRTTRRIAAWRWIFTAAGSVAIHVPSSHESGQHVLAGRSRAPIASGAAGAPSRAPDHDAVSPLRRPANCRSPRPRPSARAPSSVQSASARLGPSPASALAARASASEVELADTARRSRSRCPSGSARASRRRQGRRRRARGPRLEQGAMRHGRTGHGQPPASEPSPGPRGCRACATRAPHDRRATPPAYSRKRRRHGDAATAPRRRRMAPRPSPAGALSAGDSARCTASGRVHRSAQAHRWRDRADHSRCRARAGRCPSAPARRRIATARPPFAGDQAGSPRTDPGGGRTPPGTRSPTRRPRPGPG